MTDTPGTAVAVPTARMDPGSIAARVRYAELLSGSSLVPEAYRGKPANVFLAIEYGSMLAVHPLAALSGIHVIEGKPTISPALMTALVRQAGHKVRSGVRGTVEDGSIIGWCEVIRSDDPEHPFRAEWTLARAQRAKLLTYSTNEQGVTVVESRSRKGNPGPWMTYTEAMLKARATGEVCREAAEEVLMGAHYTPEELGAVVGEDGEVLEGEIVPDPPRPAAAPAAPQSVPPAETTDHPAPAADARQAPAQQAEQAESTEGAFDESTFAEIVDRGIASADSPDNLTAAYEGAANVYAAQAWVDGRSFVAWLKITPATFGRAVSLFDAFRDRMTTLKAAEVVEKHDRIEQQRREREIADEAARPPAQADPWADTLPPVSDGARMTEKGVAATLGVDPAQVIVEKVDPDERRDELAAESGIRHDEPAPPPLAGEHSTAREKARETARAAAEKSRQENPR